MAVFCGAFICFSMIGPVQGQSSEDQWFDASDWFDGNNYEYDDTIGLDTSYEDTYDYTYGDFGYSQGHDSFDWGMDEPVDAGIDTEWGNEDVSDTEWEMDWGAVGSRNRCCLRRIELDLER